MIKKLGLSAQDCVVGALNSDVYKTRATIVYLLKIVRKIMPNLQSTRGVKLAVYFEPNSSDF